MIRGSPAALDVKVHFSHFTGQRRACDSSVTIVTVTVWTTWESRFHSYEGQVPSWALKQLESLWNWTSLLPNVYRGLSKAAAAWSCQVPSSNAYSVSASSFVWMTWHIIKHRGICLFAHSLWFQSLSLSVPCSLCSLACRNDITNIGRMCGMVCCSVV